MKKQLTSLDLFYLVKELQPIAQSRVQKVYQIGNTIYLVLYGNQKKQTLVIAPSHLTVTEYEKEFPKEPPMFCMLLRKHLENKKILGIRQHAFERIVYIEFADRCLVCELFSDGNLILLDKNTNEIIQPLHTQEWKDRTIKARIPYQLPPAGVNTTVIDEALFKEVLRASDKDVVRTLASKLSLGGAYAEEVIARAGIYGTSMGKDLNNDTLVKIFTSMQALLSQHSAPRIYEKSAVLAPFALVRLTENQKDFPTLAEAVDEFFKETIVISGKHDELAHRLEEQKKTAERLLHEEADYRAQGDTLSQQRKFKEAGEAYEKSKKAKKKQIGLAGAIENTELALQKNQVVVKEPKKKEIAKKEWFEKFRWFRTSDSFLVIGGKDAITNDLVVKKHADKGDLVFHAEIVGAPFCIIKSEGKSISKTAIEETAQFAASYSKTWQLGRGTVDVMYAKPEQLKKDPGVPTGAFVIHGKHELCRAVPLNIAFGLDKDGKLLHGPLLAVKELTKNFVTLEPGGVKAGELASKIKRKLNYSGNVDDIQRLIPAGKGKLR